MTRFRMVLIVVGSALVFTFVGPFLYRAVGLDSPVGNCSPVGNSSPVGDNSPVSHRDHHFHRGHRDHVGDSSPVANCSPVGGNSPVGTRTADRISNALSGGGAVRPGHHGAFGHSRHRPSHTQRDEHLGSRRHRHLQHLLPQPLGSGDGPRRPPVAPSR